MYPYLREEVRLRYDLENPVIFLKNGYLWLDESINRDAQRLLSLCNGQNSLPLILKKLKKYYPRDSEDEIDLKIKQFFVMARIKGYLDFSEKPICRPIVKSGHTRRFFPTALVVELTSRCNLACQHCYLEGDRNQSFDFLFLKKFLALFREKGAYQLQLTGGEPFLYPEISQLLSFATREFCTVVVTTNATLITSEIAKELAPFKNVAYQVSLDGDEPTHNFIRGSENAFSLMAQSVQRLKMYGLEVKFAATISSLNISKMEDVATTALSLGVRDLEFGVAIPAGRGRQLPPLTLTNYKFIYENTRSLAEIYKKYGLNIRFYQEELNFQCRLVKDLIFIDSSGEVFPCVGIRTSLGNIKVTGLEEIMNREKFKLVAQLPAPTAAVCGGCRLLEFCEGCHVQGLLNGAGAENCTYCRLARKAGLTDV